MVAHTLIEIEMPEIPRQTVKKWWKSRHARLDLLREARKHNS